jgi:hypothetical protein
MPDSVQPVQIYIVLDEKPCRGSSPNPPSHASRNRSISAFNQLCERVKEHRDAIIPVNLSNAFRCLAGDIVSQYSLPQGLHNLDSEDFADSYNRQSRSISHIAVWNRHLSFAIPLFLKTPRWMVVKMATKGGVQAFDFQAVRRPGFSHVGHLLHGTC